MLQICRSEILTSIKKNTVAEIHIIPVWNDYKVMSKNYIKEMRKKRGLTQEQLAELMDVGQGTIARHERGERKMKWETIQAYARALECHPSDITDGPPELLAKTDVQREALRYLNQLSEPEQEFALRGLKAFIKDDSDATDNNHEATKPRKENKN
jgi:transcriptional regulator with XRE-family HTH domain